MRATAIKIVLLLWLAMALSYWYDQFQEWRKPIIITPTEISTEPQIDTSPIIYKRILPIDTVYLNDTLADLIEDYRDDFEFYYN